MAAQLHSKGVINLLGFTIASGNAWRDQEVAECLKAVERLGIEGRVKVYVGSQYHFCMTLSRTFTNNSCLAHPLIMSARTRAHSRVPMTWFLRPMGLLNTQSRPIRMR